MNTLNIILLDVCRETPVKDDKAIIIVDLTGTQTLSNISLNADNSLLYKEVKSVMKSDCRLKNLHCHVRGVGFL